MEKIKIISLFKKKEKKVSVDISYIKNICQHIFFLVELILSLAVKISIIHQSLYSFFNRF